jgi:hypothetical protein
MRRMLQVLLPVYRKLHMLSEFLLADPKLHMLPEFLLADPKLHMLFRKRKQLLLHPYCSIQINL